MKIQIDNARVNVNVRFTRAGSLLDFTVEGGCAGVDVHCEVDSPEDREKIAGLLRNAEAGCYVMQTFRNPTPVTATFELNGTAIEAVAPTGD